MQRTTRYTTNSNSLLVGIKPPAAANDTIAFTWDLNNFRVATVSRGGGTYTYGFAPSGDQMTTTVTDPMSREEVYKLSASQGVVTSHRDGRLRTETFGYDASGQLTQWVKPSGAKVEMIRDGRGNVTQTTFTPVSGSGQAAIVTTASYPSSCTNAVTCNQPDTTTDALGGVTNYSYDPVHGGVTKVVRPSPGGSAPRPETRYSYVTLTPSGTTDSIYRLGEARACPSGPTCSADKEVRTKYEYSNPNLYLTDVTNGSADETLKAKTHYNYDLVGNQTEIDGPLTDQVDVTFVAYNPDRSVRQVLGPDPDGAGPMKKRSIVLDRDANGAVTTTRYGTADANGGNFAELRSTVNQYDDYGRVLRTRMVKGGVARQVVDYSYNLAGQSLCTAIRMNPAAFGTSPADACVASTPGTYGADRISKSQYDDDGRTKSISNGVQTPLEQITQQMHYGAAGMVDSVKDAKLNTTSYSYDGFDRPSRTTYPDGSYEELTYDQGSRVTRKRTRDGNALTYGYDALGRVTSRGEPTSNYNPTATYAYDDFGQLTGVTATWPGSMTYTYDALGRMTSENHGWSGTIGWQYDVAGRRTRQTWPDNRFVTYEYLATGEMSAIREQGQPLLALFRYDDQGRRTSLERTNGTATAYAYDDANNEFSMAHDLAGTAQDIGYTLKYNPAGEIVSRATTNDAYGFAESVNVQRGYQANTLNQYTQSGSVTPTYDGNGNLTSAGPTNYRYTATGKLENASNEALVYDALDRIAHVSSEQTNFRYLDGEISTETAASGNGITRRYVTGPNGDEPLVWYEGADFNTRRWLYADERGSVVAVAGQDGTALAVNTYDEYGIPGSSNLGRFQYTGQAWLPSMQMSYYKARMYSPTLGRFLQPDPIGYGDGMNMYNYVGGNPVNRRDPSGLATCSTSSSPYSLNAICGSYNVPTSPGQSPSRGSGFILNPIPIVKGVICLIFGCKKNKSSPTSTSQVDSTPAPVSEATPQKTQPKPTPKKNLFGTNYCGPGGSGNPVNALDKACQAHDICYGNLGPVDNLIPQSPADASRLQHCNQQLCDATRNLPDRGSSRVRLYFELIPDRRYACH